MLFFVMFISLRPKGTKGFFFGDFFFFEVSVMLFGGAFSVAKRRAKRENLLFVCSECFPFLPKAAKKANISAKSLPLSQQTKESQHSKGQRRLRDI